MICKTCGCLTDVVREPAYECYRCYIDRQDKRIAALEAIIAKLNVPDPGLTNDELQIIGGIVARLKKGR